MRYARLPLVFAAILMLGAAPPEASPVARAAECRASHRAARAALRRLPVRETAEENTEHGFGATTSYDATGFAVAGIPVRALVASDINAIPGESLTIWTRFDAPYDAVRAAALRSIGKPACINREGAPGYCLLAESRIGGWTRTLTLDVEDGRPLLACLYWKPRR
ncbi:MAG: hypothetical protein V4574_10790 [Pseudomonadota bacterium]